MLFFGKKSSTISKLHSRLKLQSGLVVLVVNPNVMTPVIDDDKVVRLAVVL